MHANKLQKRQISVETALRELTRLAEQSAASEEGQSKFGPSKEGFSILRVLRNFDVSNPEIVFEKNLCRVPAMKTQN